MKQTNATFLVENGVLMADQDQCISLANARVTVEPIDTPPAVDGRRQQEEMVNAAIKRMDRAASRLMGWFVIGAALYLVAEVIHAFSSGAFPAVR